MDVVMRIYICELPWRKSIVTRSGDRTHADIRPLELKSNALTTRPSWCIKWKCFLFPMILEWTPGQGSIQAAWSVLLQSKFFRICNLCGSISQNYYTLLRPVGLVVWFSLRVREVPGSIPGQALAAIWFCLMFDWGWIGPSLFHLKTRGGLLV